MKLGFITIMVRDLEKSVLFYEKLAGLKVVNRFNPGMGEIVFMANGNDEMMIELICFENTPKVETKGMVLSFAADEELETLRKKAIDLGYEPTEIIEMGPKPKHFKVNDPDGITVEFGI